ncbi:DUF2255 family protein [Flavobacterium sp. '19STA2R22 D10 B1']|uniref:DUF2255 family protein n=1 Tax=Flavobacterium aerium TaxID=3037261 RepID=UPI00278BEDA3|nr:DUF2255 family protein [Flavobacterium sp. '19STA2R22 D10 B1']
MEEITKEWVLNLIQTNSLTGIKAGAERTTFLEIWMVVVEDRIFARSWGLAEKSWYNTFLIEAKGQLQCREKEFDIVASIPHDMNTITSKINAAYLEKYKDKKYALPITQQKHIEKTMEFKLASQ